MGVASLDSRDDNLPISLQGIVDRLGALGEDIEGILITNYDGLPLRSNIPNIENADKIAANVVFYTQLIGKSMRALEIDWEVSSIGSLSSYVVETKTFEIVITPDLERGLIIVVLKRKEIPELK